MSESMSNILAAAKVGLAAQDSEIAAARARWLQSVRRFAATGYADINQTFSLDRAFRLVFVRAHFIGGTGTAALVISLDSGRGSAYDTDLSTITKAGTGSDVHFQLGADALCEPSAWSYPPDDAIRIQWANPDGTNMSWGLEVGLVLATQG